MNSRFRLENIIKILLQSYEMRIREKKCKGRWINNYFPHNMQQSEMRNLFWQVWVFSHFQRDFYLLENQCFRQITLTKHYPDLHSWLRRISPHGSRSCDCQPLNCLQCSVVLLSQVRCPGDSCGSLWPGWQGGCSLPQRWWQTEAGVGWEMLLKGYGPACRARGWSQ